MASASWGMIDIIISTYIVPFLENIRHHGGVYTVRVESGLESFLIRRITHIPKDFVPVIKELLLSAAHKDDVK